MVGKVLTGNGITRCEKGSYALVGGDELSDSERDQLLELCRQRLDAFREQRGEEVDPIVPSNQGGTSDLSNLPALCFRCNAGKRDAVCLRKRAPPISAGCRPATPGARRAVCSARWRAAAGCCWRTHSKLCIAVADLVIKGQAMSFQSCTPRAMSNCQVQR
jgi:hypothetical protein